MFIRENRFFCTIRVSVVHQMLLVHVHSPRGVQDEVGVKDGVMGTGHLCHLCPSFSSTIDLGKAWVFV